MMKTVNLLVSICKEIKHSLSSYNYKKKSGKTISFFFPNTVQDGSREEFVGGSEFMGN